ncbi:type I methionyl aminopeptidase [Desulforhopalus singaporensis]|uniref:Methionine aminopeptidase n=1 Tax=Desulforhopalus singaporensis TaxID=91360 RepID=A0A1H0RCE0_9BACT|nr:type I methionyl aminopeptidase [Desulforhopalus singaporensis]SDP27050.1 methionine aminopeptidase, type I [Desulforhopalus singaporensis]
MTASGEAGDGRNIVLKSPDEIKFMLEANQIVAQTLSLLEKTIEPGITTWELDKIAEAQCEKMKVTPAFKGYRGFPACICASVNEQVVHGIPSRKTKLKKGDIISIDFGVEFKGYFGDSAITVPVGKVDSKLMRLLDVTRVSLEKGIQQVEVGNRIADISKAVQHHVEGHGFSVVRQFVGHGIGSALHEAPEIPNFHQGERTARLMPGMVLAIEPMVNMGTYKVKMLRDGWTVVTEDSKPSAHFEHSVAVTEDGPKILSYR